MYISILNTYFFIKYIFGLIITFYIYNYINTKVIKYNNITLLNLYNFFFDYIYIYLSNGVVIYFKFLFI